MSTDPRLLGPTELHRSRKRATALLLTLAAGFVDIVGYLSLYHEFTAHMTGDTVHLGNDLLQHRWPDALAAACIVGAFLAGSILGRSIIEIGRRTRIRAIASVTLLIEAALIAAVALVLGWRAETTSFVRPLLALLAAAMGVQTATLTRIGSLTVHTTFVTGMLNKLAQLLSTALFLTIDMRATPAAAGDRARVVAEAGFIASIWVMYLAGAVMGTALHAAIGERSLLVPLCLIAAAITTDQVSPLAIEEERDEA